MAEKQRLGYFDIVKGFAMLCIVAGHFDDGIVCRFVFTFHVPVFFLISGYFYHGEPGKTKKNITRLLRVYGATVLAIAFLGGIKAFLTSFRGDFLFAATAAVKRIGYWLLAGIYGSGSKSNFLTFSLPVIGAIWFLLALVWVLCAMNGLNAMEARCTGEKKKWIPMVLVVLLFFFGFISAKYTWLPFSIQAGCVSLLFFWIGYKGKRLLPQLLASSKTTILCTGIWIAAIVVSICHDYMSLVRCAFPDLMLNIVGATAATLVLLSAAKKLEMCSVLGQLNLLLKFIGENTLIFLSFHLIELNLFPWQLIGLNHMPVLRNLFLFCLKVFWCVFGTIVVRKTRLKKLFI